jgi:hypothetical protein
VTVAVGTGGVIEVYNHTGTVDVDIDVDGYYTGVGGTGSVFVPLTTPVRVADTRTASLVGTETPIAANTSESFLLATAASGIPTTATSVVSNFTVVSGDASGYLSIYPTSTTVHPVSSSVNWTANEIVPDMTIADTNGTGSVEVYNSYGTINLVVDVFGYFETLTSGPIMVSAVVTPTTTSITYNEAVVCPATGADAAFVYDWTGGAPGGTVTGCTTSATNADVLVLAASGGFTLPGSTGGSITYTAPTASTILNAVNNGATTPIFAATQTLALAASVGPAMVSAYTTTTTLVITYNEAVLCPAGNTIANDFAYSYTGVASGFTTLTAACASTGDVLTLTAATVAAPGSGANIVYTAPASPTVVSTANSLSATGAVPTLYAATQTLSGTAWTIPVIKSAVVTAGVSGTGTIAVTYNEAMSCPANPAVQAVFVYSNGGSPAYPSTCSAATDVVTLGTFYAAATGTTAETLVVPSSTDTLVYTVPASPVDTNTVYATGVFPAFPATQTYMLSLGTVPAMVSAVSAGGATLTITYNEAVSCPATGADGTFVYDSSFGTLGGSISGCATAGDVLTLSGIFNPATAAANIVYTTPVTPTTSIAVYSTANNLVFAATQTLFPVAS